MKAPLSSIAAGEEPGCRAFRSAANVLDQPVD